MNPAHIQDIITMLKDDKSCVQPWRNKAIARLEESIAFIEKGHNTTNLKPPAGLPTDAARQCTCLAPDAINASCPIHGRAV
jgi:hypothetical protein